MLRKIKKIAAGAAAVLCAVLLLVFPEEAGNGVSKGIEICLSRVVPSVFPMMLLCMAAVESGCVGYASRLLAPVSSALFGLPGEAAAAVLLSVTGGYPAGAKTVAELYRSGAVNSEQAERMVLFCFGAGPAFLLGVTGSLAGMNAAWLLLVTQILSVIITGIIVCRARPLGAFKPETQSRRAVSADASSVIVSSVGKASSAVMQVCLYVTVFSAVRALFDAAGVSAAAVRLMTALGVPQPAAEAVIPLLMEVTGGCMASVRAGLPLTAFAVGFGGLSVQLQVLDITRAIGVSPLKFFAVRCLQGAVGALLVSAALTLLPDTAVQTSAVPGSPRFSGSPQGAVMLVVMCAMCMLCLGSESKVSRSGT